MRKVYLHGSLGEKYGKEFDFDVVSAQQAVSALCANFKDPFKKDVMKGNWHIWYGKPFEEGSMSISAEEMPFEIDREIHIMPAIEGAGGDDGVVKTVVGIAIIAVGVYFGQPQLVQIGIAITLGGVSQMLTPTPRIDDIDERNQAEQQKSFLFNGAVNSVEEGGAIPVIYGIHRVGSTVISAGLDIEQIGITIPPPPIPLSAGVFTPIIGNAADNAR